MPKGHDHNRKDGYNHIRKSCKKVVVCLVTVAGFAMAAGMGHVSQVPIPAPTPNCIEIHVPVISQN
jgi:hypothetical protein